MACVYIIKSKITGKKYTGSSRENNPEKRLDEHNKGKTKSTKFGRPWEVVYFETVNDYTVARKREIFLKSGIGRKWIKDNLKI